MYREIDSSELVIYEAFQKLKELSSSDAPILLSIRAIAAVASALEKEDPTVRVNLGRKSLRHLVSKSRNTVFIEGDTIIIHNAFSPDVRQLFYQYGPSLYTKKLLKERNNE